MTGEWFLAYTRRVLAPTLKPDNVVILYNLPAHRGAAVRETIETSRAQLLFLQPYSPDFNPIENLTQMAFNSPSSLATATPPGRARCAST